MKTIAGTDYLTEDEALIETGFKSRVTLWRWRKRGLQAYCIGGRPYYTQQDIAKFVETLRYSYRPRFEAA